MGDDDKPFACPEPGCSMRFANEDHLSVHKQKHQMSLALGSTGSKSGFMFSGDQTPTPTKFLRNCEEIGLFSDLPKNPFEEAFRRATQDHTSGSHVEGSPLPVSTHDDTSLNTPTPLVHSSQEQAKVTNEAEFVPLPGPTSRGSLSTMGDTLNTPVPPLQTPMMAPSAPIPESVENQIDSSLNISEESENIQVHIEQVEVELEPCEIVTAAGSPMDLTVSKTEASEPAAALPTPVKLLSAPKSVLKTTTGSSMSALPQTASASVSSSSPVIAKQLQQPSGSQSPCMMQVLLQLPDGMTLPIHIPAEIKNEPSVTGSALSPGSSRPSSTLASMVPRPASTSPASIAVANPSSIAKRKLKEALTAQNMRVMSEAVERVTSGQVASHSLLTSPTVLLSRPMSRGPEVQAADTSTPSRWDDSKRRKMEEEDPDERRKKFLERNRAAAARCRQKKKQWITNLEQKASDLSGVNSKLQSEVVLLRNEVASLKSLLLAHKDCPVTKQQRESGEVTFQEVPTVEVTSQGMKMGSSTILITPQSGQKAETITTATASAVTVPTMAAKSSDIGQ